MLRTVQRERVVGLLYGARASFIGALHPLLAEGTNQSSHAHGRPWERLTRTGLIFEDVIFGSRATADAQLRRVEAMHRKVRGRIERDGGAYFPKGTPYSADDPELALLTMGVLADSSEVLFDTFVRPLRPEEREALWQDYLRFGEMFGVTRSLAPQTHAEFREYFYDWLLGPTHCLSPAARDAGIRVAFAPPLPLPLLLARPMTYVALAGTVPRSVLDLYGLPWGPAFDRAFELIARAHRAGLPLVPGVLRYGSVKGAFDLIRREEAFRLRFGLPTWRPDPAQADAHRSATRAARRAAPA